MDRTQVRLQSTYRRRRATLGVAVLAGGLWLGGFGHHSGVGETHRTHPETRYVVRAGDTLWSIASRLSGPREDPRPLIDSISTENGVGDVLVTGQVLVIPPRS